MRIKFCICIVLFECANCFACKVKMEPSKVSKGLIQRALSLVVNARSTFFSTQRGESSGDGLVLLCTRPQLSGEGLSAFQQYQWPVISFEVGETHWGRGVELGRWRGGSGLCRGATGWWLLLPDPMPHLRLILMPNQWPNIGCSSHHWQNSQQKLKECP